MTAADDEFVKHNERLYRINDVVQAHVLQLKELDIRVEVMGKQVLALTTQTATREQLETAVMALGIKMTAAVELMTLQIKMIAEDLAPIRKGIYWVITVVLGTVILAGLAFLLRRPGP